MKIFSYIFSSFASFVPPKVDIRDDTIMTLRSDLSNLEGRFSRVKSDLAGANRSYGHVVDELRVARIEIDSKQMLVDDQAIVIADLKNIVEDKEATIKDLSLKLSDYTAREEAAKAKAAKRKAASKSPATRLDKVNGIANRQSA